MKIFKPAYQRLNPVLAGLLLAVLFLGLSTRPVSAENLSTWQNTGIVFASPNSDDHICFDALQPGKLLTSNPSSSKPTYSIDLSNGQKTQLNSLSYYFCNEANGQLYTRGNDTENSVLWFSSTDPAGNFITHGPTHFAVDGSLWVYTLDYKTKMGLWASPDGGLTWQQRNISGLNAGILDMTVAASDGRVLYALTENNSEANRSYGVYASKDAGVTWEKRSELNYGNSGPLYTPSLYLGVQPGKTTPANVVMLNKGEGAGSNGFTTTMLSIDGGKTFVDVAIDDRFGHSNFFYSDNSIVRLKQKDTGTELANSVDGGATWQVLTLPFTPQPFNPFSFNGGVKIIQAENAPSNLFLSYADGTTGDIWHSPDGGKSWENLAPNMPNLMISPNAPTYIISLKDNRIYRMDLPKVDKTQTKGVAFSAAPDAGYFDATHHNLSGIFKKYWEEHGGLAQFGMPWTEPFRELNAETGKIYTVQYFERNRFEYHPENAGTQYDVLLGLLGNNQTANRRSEGAFVRFDDAHYPGGTYYPQTGHNLRNSFKAYWEANGGLAIYGYPISEEFEEVNPDDGKTYVVQYFERNRFEYHPENKGTKYEVLLGLLGNTLLKSKGWL